MTNTTQFAIKEKTKLLKWWIIISDGIQTGIQNLIFGYLKSAEKWVEGRLNNVFFHFFAKFLSYLMIFESSFGMHHFEKSSNKAKNEEKPCSMCLKPISPRCAAGTQNPGF